MKKIYIGNPEKINNVGNPAKINTYKKPCKNNIAGNPAKSRAAQVHEAGPPQHGLVRSINETGYNQLSPAPRQNGG